MQENMPCSYNLWPGDPLEDGGESAESIALALADTWLQKAHPIGIQEVSHTSVTSYWNGENQIIRDGKSETNIN